MEHFPHFIPFFAACYDAPADLIYGDQTIPAERAGTGSQQGCPWGTFLHGLSQKRRVERLISDNPDVRIFLLADDIFIVGLPQLVMQAYAQYDAMVTAAGGRMNMPKSRAWSPSPAAVDHPAVVAKDRAYEQARRQDQRRNPSAAEATPALVQDSANDR
eukprot:COSAG05_NODE_5624_length_1127_cov_10.079767_1_plen_159_part_00